MGKTFFSIDKLDRLYFGDDGVFYQQLENDWDAIKAGELFKGQWTFDENKYELCLDYTNPDFKELCFDIIKNYDDDNFSMFDKNGKVHLQWHIPRVGNWLFSNDGFKMIKSATDRQPIDNSDAIDQKIENYMVNKIFSGFGGVLSFMKDDGTGFYRDRKTKQKKPFVYNISNLRVVSKDVNGKNLDDVLITLGDEFLEDKPTKAYFYLRSDIITVEGEGKFDLTPIENHSEKDF